MNEPTFHHRQNKNGLLVDRIRRDGLEKTIRLLSGLISLVLIIGVSVSPRVSGQPQVLDDLSADIQIPPPPFTDGIFPCMDCHADMETNPERRALEDFHDDIVLKHDEENRWCMDCHDAENRDMLHSASGKPISFTESYKLCGQCHGPKLRDWKAGIHGRRTGSWNGQKEYLLCAHCHNPHSPEFKKIKPEAPPLKPGEIR
ncbi:MAG: hypothetical protein KKD56_00460 [Acidobacteria bacterium]|nr:hypothetical protein [Acidobacteriota bacterium]MBU1337520.1 hypothetical protein [Acidobacteriota bacterium]